MAKKDKVKSHHEIDADSRKAINSKIKHYGDLEISDQSTDEILDICIVGKRIIEHIKIIDVEPGVPPMDNNPILQAIGELKNMILDDRKLAQERHEQYQQQFAEIKQDIKEIRQEIVVIKQRLDQHDEEIAMLKKDMVEVKQEIVVMKADIVVLKADVAELKTDVAVLKTDVTELKTDVAELKSNVKLILDKLS